MTLFMKKFILLAIAVLSCGIIAAQDADRMMATLIRTIGDKGISCDATISAGNGNDEIRVRLIMKGEQWFLQTPETAVWYDGKTEYSGIVEDDKVIEVMIQECSTEEQMSGNPFLVIKHHDGFNVSATDSRTLVLTAEDQKKGAYEGILKVVVTFGTDNRPTLIRIRQKDMGDSDITMKITRYETGTTSESDFTFPKDKWPDAEIIDLR